MDSNTYANESPDSALLGNRMPRMLVTAGPTHEPIDQVRYLSNRSSGRMGIALAEACAARRWPVTLLLGPIGASPRLHTAIECHRFQTTADLLSLLLELWPAHDVLFMAAAVADYTVQPVSTQKLKRGKHPLTLELRPTPDLLATMTADKRPNQFVVGFALESVSELESEARRKLAAKHLDAIVANPLDTMDSERISATLIWSDGTTAPAPTALLKSEFAKWLIDQVEPRVAQRLNR